MSYKLYIIKCIHVYASLWENNMSVNITTTKIHTIVTHWNPSDIQEIPVRGGIPLGSHWDPNEIQN